MRRRELFSLLDLCAPFGLSKSEASVTAGGASRENLYSGVETFPEEIGELLAGADLEELIYPVPRRTYMTVASWYRHGRVTANGETFNPHGFTAAHRRLPFGTMVRMTNLDNNKSVTVRINDRGPFKRGREYDLSLAAAIDLGIRDQGVARLRAEVY